MAMDQYLLIPFLVGWTSIYQLFWCSPGVQGFDTLPYFLKEPDEKTIQVTNAGASVVALAQVCPGQAAAAALSTPINPQSLMEFSQHMPTHTGKSQGDNWYNGCIYIYTYTTNLTW